MVNTKQVWVNDECFNLIHSFKIIPVEPNGDCVLRILKEYVEFKKGIK